VLRILQSRKAKIIGTIAAFVLGWVPQWWASIWSLFSAEPFARVMARNGVRLPFSLLWITTPLGLGMLLSILVLLRQEKLETGLPIAGMSKEQLRRATVRHARELREFQKRADTMLRRALSDVPGYPVSASIIANDFGPLRSKAVAIWIELLHQLRRPRPTHNDATLTSAQQIAVSLLETGGYAGAEPASNIADYLEGLAHQLT